MPRITKPLTEIEVRKVKPIDKPVRLFDGGGLYLEVSPSGGKLWRPKYRYLDRDRLMGLGQYPEVSLADARTRREDARKLVANGVDPCEVKKADRAAKLEKVREQSFSRSGA